MGALAAACSAGSTAAAAGMHSGSPCVQHDNSVREDAVPECCPVQLLTNRVRCQVVLCRAVPSCQPEVTIAAEILTLCVEAGLPSLVLCDFVQGVLSAVLILAECLLGLWHIHLQGDRQHV